MKRKTRNSVTARSGPTKGPTAHGIDTPSRHLAGYCLAALIALLTFAVYLPVLRNGFVNWDDTIYILENVPIRSLRWDFFHWAFTDTSVALYWHPLTWISHAVDYALWGTNPLGHHLTSNILHALNTGIVACLTISLIEIVKHNRDEPARVMVFDRRAILITGGVTGMLFGIHPLHVESVAWISQRKDLLYSLFYLLSIMSYLRHARTRGSTGVQRPFYLDRWYCISLAMFILALCSKPMAVTLPAVLLLLDWYPLNRFLSKANIVTLLKEKLPFIALGSIISAITIITQQTAGVQEFAESYPLSSRLPVAFRALMMYLREIIAPVNLLPLYPYPETLSLTSPLFLLAAGVVFLVTAGCVILVRRYPFGLAAWLFFLITVAPTLGIKQVGADRYIYLSTIGPYILFGLISSLAWAKVAKGGLGIRLIAAGMAIFLLVSLSFITTRQIAYWNNSLTLWNYVVDNWPRNATAFNYRGHVFKNSKLFDKAIEDYSRAIEIKPSFANYYVNRGVAYSEKREFAKALDDLNKAIGLNPTEYMAFNNRGNIYYYQGDIERALADFNAAIMLNPEGSLAFNNRGVVFKAKGEKELAKADFDKAISLSPYYADAYYNRAVIFKERGDVFRAIEDINKVLSLTPGLTQAYLDRGDLYRKNGNMELARKDYQQACAMGNSTGCINLSPK